MSGGRWVVVASALAAATADAAEPPKKTDEPLRRWHLGVDAVTVVPLSVGGRIGVESPGGIRLSTTLGAMPEAYVALANEALLAAKAYDEPVGDLIVNVLGGSLVWQIEAGWRPFPRLGWYFEAGYGFAALGGSVAPEGVLAAVASVPVELVQAAGIRSYEIESTLHWVVAETGYEFYIADLLVIRASLFFAATVAAHTSGELRFEGYDEQNAIIQAFVHDAEDSLDDLYTSYFFVPSFLFSVGYRFAGPEVVED